MRANSPLTPLGALSIGILADLARDRIALGILGTIPMIFLTGALAFGGRQLRAL